MRLRTACLLLCLVICGAPHAPAASILISGNSMDSSNTSLTSQVNSLGYVVTFGTPSTFSATSLAGYNAVWLDGFSHYGNDGTLAAKLTAFLNTGGTVLVQNPGFGTESLTSYPLGAQLFATYTYPPGENLVRIVNASHPLNAGLTGAGLSGWNPAAFGKFDETPGQFVVVTDNGTANEWITLATQVGMGNLIYTQQGISQRLSGTTDAQALAFLNNAVALAVPEPSSLALLGIAGMWVAQRRIRRQAREPVTESKAT